MQSKTYKLHTKFKRYKMNALTNYINSLPLNKLPTHNTNKRKSIHNNNDQPTPKKARKIPIVSKISKLFEKKVNQDIQHFEDHGLPICCKHNCLIQFPVDYIKHQREMVFTMSQIDKHKFILEKVLPKDDYHSTKRFVIDGKEVCLKCFETVFGVSRKIVNSNTAIKVRQNSTPKLTEIVYFLKDIGEWHNIMPDSKEIHLPYVCKYDVYNLYTEVYKDQAASYKYFVRIWKRKMFHIKIRKVHRFTKCGKCVTLREKIAASIDVTINKNLKKILFEHINRQLLDREVFELNCRLASTNPETYLSMIIDGADFQRYGLPYFYEKDKNSDKGYKIPINMFAVKIHGHGEMLFTFPSNLPSDPNAIIHCLHNSLTTIKEKYDVASCNWPSTLFLQVF